MQEESTVVTVRNPVTYRKRNKLLYTDYKITVQTDSKAFRLPVSTVRRRFSEFVWLRSQLERTGRKLPELPPKTLFRRFDVPFIDARCKGLESFMQGIMKTKVFLANRSVHLFLQSLLTTDEIDGVVSGDFKYIEEPSTKSTRHTPSTLVNDEKALSDESNDSSDKDQE